MVQVVKAFNRWRSGYGNYVAGLFYCNDSFYFEGSVVTYNKIDEMVELGFDINDIVRDSFSINHAEKINSNEHLKSLLSDSEYDLVFPEFRKYKITLLTN